MILRFLFFAVGRKNVELAKHTEFYLLASCCLLLVGSLATLSLVALSIFNLMRKLLLIV